MNSEEEQYKWLDKAIDIQIEIVGNFDDGLSILVVREKDPKAALEMAECLYKDYLLNVGKPNYEWMKPFGKMLEGFNQGDKPKAIGFLYEVLDLSEREGRKGEVSKEEFLKVAGNWSLEEEHIALLKAFFNIS